MDLSVEKQLFLKGMIVLKIKSREQSKIVIDFCKKYKIKIGKIFTIDTYKYYPYYFIDPNNKRIDAHSSLKSALNNAAWNSKYIKEFNTVFSEKDIIKIEKEDEKMKKIRVFISQPMSGLSLDEQKEIRRRAENDVIHIYKKYGVPEDHIEFIESDWDTAGPDASQLKYLAIALLDLDTADVAYFADGWSLKRGCIMEHLICKNYNIPIIKD